jgi:hypothetical protein
MALGWTVVKLSLLCPILISPQWKVAVLPNALAVRTIRQMLTPTAPRSANLPPRHRLARKTNLLANMGLPLKSCVAWRMLVWTRCSLCAVVGATLSGGSEMGAVNMWTKFWFVAFLMMAPAAATAQVNDTNTRVVPQPSFSNNDENGVNIAIGTKDVQGPAISIGTRGGLSLVPTVAGSSLSSFGTGCFSGCFVSGFFRIPTNLAYSLTISSWGYEQNTFGSISAGTDRGVFRFRSTTAFPSSIVETAPSVGRTLTYSAGNPSAFPLDTGERMTLTDTDGSKYVYLMVSNWCINYTCTPSTANPSGQNFQNNTVGGSHAFPIEKIVRPNGETIKYYYAVTASQGPFDYQNPAYQLLSIVSNSGYMLKFQYGSFSMGGTTYTNNPVVAVNLALESCSPTTNACSFSSVWPILTGFRQPIATPIPNSTIISYSMNFPQSLTEPGGGTTTVSSTPVVANALTQTVTRPNGSSESVTLDLTNAAIPPTNLACPGVNATISIVYLTVQCPLPRATRYTRGVLIWNYNTTFNLSLVSGQTTQGYVSSTTTTRTDPDGKTRTANAIASGQLTSLTDEIGRVTTVNVLPLFNPNEGRINSIASPEGNSKSYVYDARGNVTQATEIAKPGSGLANLVTNIAYPASCTNGVTCNKPASVTDPKGYVASFIYDAVSGEVLAETSPPDASGINPVKRHSYTQMYAWVSNGAGGYVQGDSAIWLRTQTRTCRTTPTVGNACAGGVADEVVTSYDYGQQSGPNNLELRGVSVAADGQTQRTCFTYDKLGNKVSETKSLGTAGVCP